MRLPGLPYSGGYPLAVPWNPSSFLRFDLPKASSLCIHSHLPDSKNVTSSVTYVRVIYKTRASWPDRVPCVEIFRHSLPRQALRTRNESTWLTLLIDRWTYGRWRRDVTYCFRLRSPSKNLASDAASLATCGGNQDA